VDVGGLYRNYFWAERKSEREAIGEGRSGNGTLPQIGREGMLVVFLQKHRPARREQEVALQW
jgi:hypothetical protein